MLLPSLSSATARPAATYPTRSSRPAQQVIVSGTMSGLLLLNCPPHPATASAASQVQALSPAGHCAGRHVGLATAKLSPATATASAASQVQAASPADHRAGHHVGLATAKLHPAPATTTAASQVQAASPQAIVLDTMSGWGVNGSLVTLLPDQPLPPTPPPPTAYSSHSLPAGAVAGIVIAAVVMAGVGISVILLLLRRHR